METWQSESKQMVISFNITKVIQASAMLLKQHGGRMSRLRLLKLLYIADRESLAETLQPITGDHAVAMDHGPVLSQTYSLIKREHYQSALWDQYITQEGPQDHRLLAEPGNGKLSRYEIEKLIQVSERYRLSNDYDIAIETHKYQEWINNQPQPGSSRFIPFDDVLAALNLTQYKPQLEAEAHDEAELDRLLGVAGHP